MLAARNPESRALVFCVDRGRLGKLTGIAEGILMGGRVPLSGMPFGQRPGGIDRPDQNGNVLGIQQMTIDISAIGGPKVVEMCFDEETERVRTPDKYLPI